MEYTEEQQAAHREMLAKELESGRWEQGKGQLRYAGKHCCLGVGSEISGVGKWLGNIYCTVGCIPTTTTLVPPVQSFYGMNSAGSFDYDKLPAGSLEAIRPEASFVPDCLGQMNDKGWTFAQIAQVIRLVSLHNAWVR